MKKSRYVRIIVGEEVRKDDSIEYVLLTGVRSTFRVPEGLMAIEVLQNEEIFGGGKNGGRKGLSSAIRKRANRESINIKK